MHVRIYTYIHTKGCDFKKANSAFLLVIAVCTINAEPATSATIQGSPAFPDNRTSAV